jgi:hypothetical protein
MGWWHSAAEQFGLDDPQAARVDDTVQFEIDWQTITAADFMPAGSLGFGPPVGAPHDVPGAVTTAPPPPVPPASAQIPAPPAAVGAALEPSLLPPGSEASGEAPTTGAAASAPAGPSYGELAARVASIESQLAAVAAAVEPTMLKQEAQEGDTTPVTLLDEPPIAAPVAPLAAPSTAPVDLPAPVAAVIDSPAPPAAPAPGADHVAPAQSSSVPAQRSSGGALRMLVIVALLAVAGFVATRNPAPASDAATSATAVGISDGELMVIASDITAAMQQDPVTKNASSGYVRKSGLVLIVATSGLLPSDLSTWIDRQLTPYAERLAGLPEGEGVLVAMHFVDAPGFDRLVRMDPANVTDPAAWVIVPIAGGLPQALVGETAGDDVAPATSVAAEDPAAGAEGAEGAGDGAEPVTSDPATPASSTPAAEGGAASDDLVVADDFAAGDGQWRGLAGVWEVVDGAYRQTDALGFDLISRLDVNVPASYEFEVSLRGVDGSPINAGIILAQANPGTREGATIIDFADGGATIRWGRYAAVGGAYEYIGGVALETPLDPNEWHTLRVVVKGPSTIVYVNDEQIGDAGLVGAGAIGLVTSQSSVEFDNVKVTAV